ncbi:hypothetical protein CAPTEDRAFT_185777 [Capitella teleta]|uniref:RGS domain-containing protein n=1 Tax=Capitella teleta TaxID=283909 RepID=R7VM64_CAPTE|nr:hypothetical protein CAPTEDRAFT_185777 [Capitella teleta]|eukprot:ELU18295.1 hypothetical protein CAPTEDRAFT_185777 [Capitella teleta]
MRLSDKEVGASNLGSCSWSGITRSFPEPLSFNRDTGGFEVISKERHALLQEVKAAARAGQRKKKIYRATRNHSYSCIPLIPMEEPPVPPEREIDTSFTVQTLNKEQGIEWIKAQRLPGFLKSDCYMEYRIAKLISQVPSQNTAPLTTFRIDYSEPERRLTEIKEEVSQVDDSKVIMNRMFVTMGNASPSATAAWVSQAKDALKTSTTTSTSTAPSISAGLVRPTSSRPVSSRSRRPTSGRPVSSTNSFCDSGVASPTKSSMLGVPDAYSIDGDNEDEEELVSTSRPSHTKATRQVCKISSQDGPRFPGLVYVAPPDVSDSEEEEEETASVESRDSAIDDTEPYVFQDLDDLSAFIAGASLMSAIANVQQVPLSSVSPDHPDLRKLNSNKRLNRVCSQDLHNLQYLIKNLDDGAGADKKKSDGEDSVLDSEDDEEDDRDDMIKPKKKPKTYTLNNKKGIEHFKKFLRATPGEKNWWFWVDIEKARSIEDTEELAMFLSAMRERYTNSGSALELSIESKCELGLVEASHWNIDKLKAIHLRMAEPLLVYWAPSFILKQELKVNPNKHYLYHQQKKIQNPNLELVYPNPPTATLLPLRPKTCIPRVRDATAHAPVIMDMFAEATVFKPKPPEISPAERATEDRKRRLKTFCGKTPKELLTPKQPDGKFRRAHSAKVHSAAGSRSRLFSETVDSASVLSSATSDRREESLSRRSSLSIASSTQSDFPGGRRMEGLLQALANEGPSGQFMRSGIKQTNNVLWKNSLEFWQQVQQYHRIFYADVLDPYLLRNKAKNLYSIFIVPGAPKSIRCQPQMHNEIFASLDPPYEDLFDSAEEYILSILFEAWSQIVTLDLNTFDKVELVPIKRHLETKSKYVASLQKRGVIKERPKTPDDPMEGYQDPIYDETLIDQIPPEFRDFTLEKLVRNRIELEHLRSFLAEHYASTDLLCWMDIEAFRRTPHTDEKKRDTRAKDIKVKYLNKKYFFGPNSPAGKDGQDKVMQAGGGWGKLLDDRPPTASLVEAQKYVRERLEKKWLPLFLATDNFAQRQRPSSGMDDVVEDVMIQRKKKSQAIWKMLESKWISSSKDILTFRKALNNPVTSLQFRKFVSIKGENFENDVLFWQEVQRYKDLCHVHSDKSLTQHKTIAIINCFIDSPIPPCLQIDIPQEMADKIIGRRLEATPYLFREAQLTVFRVLFSLWADFCVYRSQVTNDKIVPTLERHRRKARADDKRRKREMEESKEREEARRLRFGLAGDDDFDPFEKDGSEAGGSSSGGADGLGEKVKDTVAWSYSKYMKGLDAEDVLNNVDEQTFSSLSSFNLNGELKDDDDLSCNDSGSESSSADFNTKRLPKRRSSKTQRNVNSVKQDTKPNKIVRVVSPKSRPDISSSSQNDSLPVKRSTKK